MNMPPMKARCLRGALLAASTQELPATNKRNPMTTKSLTSQMTSAVNRIATRGTSSSPAAVSAIQKKILF